VAERSDALCVVASEERGSISIARDAALHPLDGKDALADELRAFLGGGAGGRAIRSRVLAGHHFEKLMAVAIAFISWFVLVHGADATQRTYNVPVTISGLSPDQEVAKISQQQVRITFSGPRREFFFTGSGNIKLTVPLHDQPHGSRVHALTSELLSYPKNLTVKAIEPSRVVVTLARRRPAAASAAPKADRPRPRPTR
jgi:hypothetical protein